MDRWLTTVGNVILQRPRPLLFLSLFLCLACAPGMRLLTTNFGIRIWLPQNNPLIQPLDDFERNFGNDEAVVVALADDQGIFNARTIRILQDLTDSLELVAGIQRVDSLANHNSVYGEEEAINIAPFLSSNLDLTAEELAAKRHRALADELIIGYLLDADAHTTLLYAWLQPTFEQEPDYRQIMNTVRQLTAAYAHEPGLVIHLTGAGALNDAFQGASERDLSLIFPLLAGVIFVMLWLIYRRLVMVILPLALIVMTNVIIFGLLGYTGIAINSMLSVVPLLIIAIAVADSIHLINDLVRYLRDGLDREAALTRAVRENLLPTILTSGTTAIGFAGLASTPLIPIQQLALAASLAALFAWGLTFSFVVPVLRLLPRRWLHFPPLQSHRRKLDPFLERYSTFLEAQRYPIFIAGLVAALVGAYFVSQVRIDSEPNAYFAADVPIKIANDFVQREIGGFNGPEIVLDSGQPGGAKDPAFLRQVEALETWLDRKPYVNQTVSVVDTIKTVHRAFHAEAPEFYVLPQATEVIAQELFVYTLGLPEGRSLDDLMDVSEQYIRLSVYWRLTKSSDSLTAVGEIEDKMAELGLNGHVTGKYFILYRLNTFVVTTLFRSLAISFISVTLILLITFRSMKLGLSAIFANILPVLAGGMAIVLLGKSVNFATAMVVSICLGIAVDDTIHFCSAYCSQQATARSPQHLLYTVFRSTGHALVLTTLLLITGFGAFLLGDFIPNVELGLLCCIVLLAALLADVVWLPCVLSIFHCTRK